jgi:hypothetical protein
MALAAWRQRVAVGFGVMNAGKIRSPVGWRKAVPARASAVSGQGFLRNFICTSLDQWFSNARTQVDK